MVLFDFVIPEEYSIMLMLAYMENTNVGKAEPCVNLVHLDGWLHIPS